MAALSALAGCEGLDHDAAFRVGLAAGTVLSHPAVDRERPADVDPEIDGAWGGAGFVEIVADDTVHLRALVHREHHPVAGTGTSAEFTEALAFALVAPRIELSNDFAVKPTFGVGLGHGSIATDSILDLGARKGLAAAVALGGELEFARHAFAGVMMWGSIFGEPGNTDGSAANALFYAGVRF